MSKTFAFRTTMLAIPLIVLASCAQPAPAFAANPPSLSKQCEEQGNQLGALVALVHASKTDAEQEVTLKLLTRLAETQPELVDAVVNAAEAGLTGAFVKKAFTEACLAEVV